ncbi:uncharacterized protein UTRI_01608 [Ustilago trichophora]|uniref:Endonuclease/exonuclease/phosphatase domain-containing protein n=1 Tax=Ustilago trichophora TaxID=86804 RepID=A0A5C3DZ38_9BASI|nr:uncharacterized protein UTRI_01608 [Ustilago trichophora]
MFAQFTTQDQGQQKVETASLFWSQMLGTEVEHSAPSGSRHIPQEVEHSAPSPMEEEEVEHLAPSTFRVASWNAYNLGKRKVNFKDATNKALQTSSASRNVALHPKVGLLLDQMQQSGSPQNSGSLEQMLAILVKIQLFQKIYGLSKTIYIWSIHAPPSSGSKSFFTLENLPFDQFFPEYWQADEEEEAKDRQHNDKPPSLPLVIIGADWNAVPNWNADTVGSSYRNTKWRPIASLIDPIGLVDAYQHVHPTGNSFSRHIATTSVHRVALVSFGQGQQAPASTSRQKLFGSDGFYALDDVKSFLWAWESTLASSPSSFAASQGISSGLAGFASLMILKLELQNRLHQAEQAIQAQHDVQRQAMRQQMIASDAQHQHAAEAKLRWLVFATTLQDKDSSWPMDGKPFVPAGFQGMEFSMDLAANLGGLYMLFDPVDPTAAEVVLQPSSGGLSNSAASILHLLKQRCFPIMENFLVLVQMASILQLSP